MNKLNCHLQNCLKSGAAAAGQRKGLIFHIWINRNVI